MPPSAANRSTLPATISIRRSKRSTITPAKSTNSNHGSRCATTSPATSAGSRVMAAASSGSTASVMPSARFADAVPPHRSGYARGACGARSGCEASGFSLAREGDICSSLTARPLLHSPHRHDFSTNLARPLEHTFEPWQNGVMPSRRLARHSHRHVGDVRGACRRADRRRRPAHRAAQNCPRCGGGSTPRRRRLAAEIAHRSRHELGHDGLAQRLGARTPQILVQRITGATAREAQTLVRVGSLVARCVRMPAAGSDPAPDADAGATVPWLAAVAREVAAGRLSIAAADAIQLGLGSIEGVTRPRRLGHCAHAGGQINCSASRPPSRSNNSPSAHASCGPRSTIDGVRDREQPAARAPVPAHHAAG